MHLAALGGHIEVIKYLLPLFGVRVHEKDMNSYTMLHWAAWGGHCQVAGYLIQELQMDPQNRDKVGGCQGTVRFQRARSTCVYGLLCAVKHVVTKQVSRGQVYVQSCVMPSESHPTLCLLY